MLEEEEFLGEDVHLETPKDRTQASALKFWKDAVKGAFVQSILTMPPLVAQSSAFQILE